MSIVQLINKNAKNHSPYINGFVNHLPMGQFALYKLTNDDIERVEEYTKHYIENTTISKVKENYEKVNSIEECLGKRNLYEPCLDLIREMLKKKDLEEFVSFILNKYTLGLSSGLFHTIIRLAYAIEGYKLNRESQEEVERALAYYITAYREAGLFENKVSEKEALKEMNKLMENPKIKEIKNSDISLGKKLKSFYEGEEFLNQGFVIKGTESDKVKGILKILIPAFYNSNNIVMLHTITGLQAVVTLQDYFHDYEKALDILSTTAIAHILTQKDLDISIQDTKIDKNWEDIAKLASNSKNVHTIKMAYSSRKLDNIFKVEGLKYAINKRIVEEI